MANTYLYTMPKAVVEPFDAANVAMNITMFLLANQKGVFGKINTMIKQRDQKRLFGRVLSLKALSIDGTTETVTDKDGTEHFSVATFC